MKKVLLFASILIISQNCASFRGGNIHKGKITDLKPEEKKISIDFNVTVRSDTATTGGMDGKYAAVLNDTFTKSKRFDRIQDGRGKEDVHIDILVDMKYLNMGIASVSSFFCGISLTTIPCYMGTASHNVTFDVFEKGKLVKSYKYPNMQISYWGGILMIPFAIFLDSNKEIDKMIQQTYIQFLIDLDRDEFFTKKI